MKYKIKLTTLFKKDLKRAIISGMDINKLNSIVNRIANGESLESKYRDHNLINDRYYKNVRECHIEPDWLLMYSLNDKYLVLELIRTGSHSNLFMQ